MRLKHFSVAFGQQLFKAFGDDSRVRILHLLWRNQEMCISDLEQVLDFTQTKTSRQLLYLKNAGLVNFRRLDNWAFYFIKDEVTDLVVQLLALMEKDAQLLHDQQIYQTLWSNRELAAYKLQNRRWTGMP
ncbi:ArsR/SmtB family transcription factor [Hymenobacter chitinivorans]|uniref:DNA-binding transcriptional ArsR family regulator n=1 Tax=Hymenobacter chitinivorans DSM 11115 TaxID=1121954 RepID=A0A2M9AQ00_9BACT|nr:metalloregulator ArsR/SmtB family transcription factor [Hymenobacter chitinivorans]PJJ47713.1 DNA-binding transcriptional ArsR family regulator [Hymenobacter chitinivorans DSM 11115]